MRLLLSGVLTAALLCSSCMASANKGKRADDNSNVGRIEALTKHVTKTIAEVSADMLPMLGAVGKEVLLEAQSDVPKVAKEIGSQVTHLSPLRNSRQDSR